MSQRRIILVASFGVLAFVLALASLAWACAPQGTVALTPDTGRAGASVTATVNGFPADPVELRWGSNTGPVLANGTGPRFSATFTVPSAAAGAYVVVAQTADEHGLHSQGRAVFTIPEPPADPPSPPPPSPPSPSPKPTPGLPLNPVGPLFPSSPSSKGKTIQGTSGGDTLVGTPFDDVITCGAGNDRVRGGGGNDVINCGAGKDRVDGGAGNDRVSGGAGRDTLAGGRGNDRLTGGAGNDTLRGDAGRDRLFGGAGHDVLYRDPADVLSGGAGVDRMVSAGSRRAR